MNSELKARLERLGPVRDAVPSRSFSDERSPVLLRRTGPFAQRITVAQRLREAGLSLRAAHAVITRLASHDSAICEIPVDVSLSDLARDLAPLDVELRRPRTIADPARLLVETRERHGLSQRDFADALGLDVRTLQNWEQGRNRPDAAALSLVTLFDRDPHLVEDVTFEPAPASLPTAAE